MYCYADCIIGGDRGEKVLRGWYGSGGEARALPDEKSRDQESTRQCDRVLKQNLRSSRNLIRGTCTQGIVNSLCDAHQRAVFLFHPHQLHGKRSIAEVVGSRVCQVVQISIILSQK